METKLSRIFKEFMDMLQNNSYDYSDFIINRYILRVTVSYDLHTVEGLVIVVVIGSCNIREGFHIGVAHEGR